MKQASDPRHQLRASIIKELFAYSFQSQKVQTPTTTQVLKHLDQIDTRITHAAPQWPLTKVAKVDLAILRLAVYELLLAKSAPPKVIIDEAVELAKEFGSETSSGFVNGVLGTIYKSMAKS